MDTTTGNKTIAETRFSSTYGKFELSVIDITGDGNEEFILIQGNGRGTNARQENVIVLKRSGQSLTQILNEPRSDYFGSGKLWWYQHRFISKASDTVLQLVLENDPIDENCILCDPSLLPQEKIKSFVFDKDKGLMVAED